MINNVINVILIFVMLLVGNKSLARGVVFYWLCAFMAPVFDLMGFRFSFEMIGFLPVLLLYLCKRKWKASVNTFELGILAHIVLLTVIMMLASLVYHGSLSIVNLYAWLRFLCMLIITRTTFQNAPEKYIDRLLTVLLAANLICCVVQMTIPNTIDFFYDFYYKDTLTPLRQQLNKTYFDRAYGTTGTPVIVGCISALAFTFYFGRYLSKGTTIRFVPVKLIVSCVIGIMALSKTAILAIPFMCLFMLFYCLIVNVRKRKLTLPHRVVRSILALLSVVAVLLLLYGWMQSRGFAISWYLQFLSKPLASLETRYGENGLLQNTLEVIAEHWLFGVGFTNLNNAFIGDSLYTVLLYRGGVVGLLSYALPYIVCSVQAVRKRNLYGPAISVCIFLLGVGSSLAYSYYITPFMAIAFVEDMGTSNTQRVSHLRGAKERIKKELSNPG